MSEISPELTIRAQQTDSGILEKMKGKILQSFFTTKKGTQGTGLGLSITNDIVKAHGDKLSVSAQAAISGTTFTIVLAK